MSDLTHAAPDSQPSRPLRILPVIAIVRGGRPDEVEERLNNLAALSPAIGKIWLLQAPRDPAVDRIADAFAARTTPPRLSLVSADRAMGPWWPLMIAWFVRAPFTLLVGPGTRLAPHFAGLAVETLRKHRAVVSPAGRKDGRPVMPGAAAIDVEAGEGAWIFDAQWIRHAWSGPPANLGDDPLPIFVAALGRAGIGAVVPALSRGRGHLLGPPAA